MSAPSAGRSRARLEFAAAVGLDLIAAATALLLCTRAWQSVLLARPRPLGDEVLHVSGRTVTAAPTAFALVALAGVVAVLASRGLARRLVGLVLVGAGVGVAASAAGAMTRLSAQRIRMLAEGRHVVGLGAPSTWRVSVHAGWAAGCVAAGVLIALVGVLVCLRGGRWAAMSARYTAPVAGAGHRPSDSESGSESVAASGDDQQQARIQSSMWSALERGEDPTAPGGAGLE